MPDHIKQHWLSVVVSNKPEASYRDDLTTYENVLSITFYEGRWSLHTATEVIILPQGHSPVFINGTGTTLRER